MLPTIVKNTRLLYTVKILIFLNLPKVKVKMQEGDIMQESRKKNWFLTVVLLVFTVSLAGCSEAPNGSNASGTLKVGVRSNIINFGYLNEETGRYSGLEIDIANEMAKRMGYAEVELIPVTPDDRKQMLLDGEVDCLVATYTISDTRLENFDFSPPYFTDKMGVMVEKSTLFTMLTDLKDKNIGVLSGTNAGPLLAQKLAHLGIIGGEVLSNDDSETIYDHAKITKAQSYEELSIMLEEGAVDAACLDGSIAGTYMNEERTFINTVISEQEYGVATQKDSALSKKTAEAIQEMLDDGTIEALIDKWN